ncbi:MAG: hypothetical protein GX493_06220 [Firmicutes bacterium]|nr:hypothetical protein [Bacillota bacterium]
MPGENLTFATKGEALKAGFIPAKVRTVERYRGGRIYIADVSGPNAFGYEFALRAELNGRTLGTFALSRSIWLTEARNRIGQPGAFTVMFAPEDFDRGLRAAREAIDKALERSEGA